MEAENSARKPWLAAVLTVGIPGLGHVYCGRWKRGLMFYGLVILTSVVAFSTFLIRSLVPINLIFGILLVPVIDILLIFELVSYIKSLGGEYKLKPFNRWYYYVAIWAVSAFVINPSVRSVVNETVAESFAVPTGAMESTIMIGDWIIGDMRKSNISNLQQGDVIIFKYPHDPKEKYVKRLVAGPGQVVKIVDREILIDGEAFFQPEHIQYVDPQPKAAEWIDPNIFPRGNGNKDYYGPVRIPAKGDTLSAMTDRDILWYVTLMDGHQPLLQGNRMMLGGQPISYYVVEQDYYFMMGDNRDRSFDSRFWGFVPHDHILGETLYVYFSINMKRFPFLTWERIKRIGTVIR